MLNSIYEKEYDPDTDAWFYVNKVTSTRGFQRWVRVVEHI